jgi:hypothetical protein
LFLRVVLEVVVNVEVVGVDVEEKKCCRVGWRALLIDLERRQKLFTWRMVCDAMAGSRNRDLSPEPNKDTYTGKDVLKRKELGSYDGIVTWIVKLILAIYGLLRETLIANFGSICVLYQGKAKKKWCQE